MSITSDSFDGHVCLVYRMTMRSTPANTKVTAVMHKHTSTVFHNIYWVRLPASCLCSPNRTHKASGSVHKHLAGFLKKTPKI
ncbi:hypothetical protein COEREDRAFT_79974, partial [Coemansia reversa NRRL 1564]